MPAAALRPTAPLVPHESRDRLNTVALARYGFRAPSARHVLVEEPEPGVWIVRTATVIPDNERWLHEPAAAASLQAAMAWSASHPPADSDLDESLKCLGRDEA